jgi:hypothetical protein
MVTSITTASHSNGGTRCVREDVDVMKLGAGCGAPVRAARPGQPGLLLWFWRQRGSGGGPGLIPIELGRADAGVDAGDGQRRRRQRQAQALVGPSLDKP